MNPIDCLVTVGQSPELALAELRCVLLRLVKPAPIIPTPSPFQYRISLHPHTPPKLINQLGGAVKVGVSIGKFTFSQLGQEISTFTKDHHFTKLALSSFSLTRSELINIAKAAKNITKFHFRLLDSPQESSGITTKYQELMLESTPAQDTIHIFHTLAVQDLYRWTQKDYHRPRVDPKSGMLPPKISRLLINLGLETTPRSTVRLLDPFCGSGTILMEGMDLGLSVIGVDIKQTAIESSRANLDWFKTTFNPAGSYQLLHQDATQLKLADLLGPVDLVVFEGYLGPPHLTEAKIPNLHKGLDKLYRGVLHKLNPLIKSHGMIVAALPQYQLGPVKTFDHLVDSCEKYGYTALKPVLTYGRKSAKIKRSIYRFRKN